MSVIDRIKEATGVAEPLNDEQATQAAIEKVEADDKKREERGKKVKSFKDKVVDKIAKDDDVDKILDGKDEPAPAPVDDTVDDLTNNVDDDSAIAKIINEDATVAAVEKDAEVVETTELIRKSTDKEDKNMAATAMKDLDFYQGIYKEMYDYDRGYPMSASLRDWIKSAVVRDETLIEELVVSELPKVLKAHPELISKVKATATEVANDNILYAVTYISKLDGKEYEDEKDAEASIETLKKVGVTFESAFQGAWRKVNPDGSLGARANRKEVETYIDNFDGDQAALRKKLHLENEKPKRSDEAPKAKKPAAPKDPSKPGKDDKNGNTGSDQEG